MSAFDNEQAIRAHADTVWRVCVLHLGAGFDAQDAFQETFSRMCESHPTFESGEHCKAWLIRVATNVCKDMLRRSERKNASIDQTSLAQTAPSVSACEIPGGTHAEIFDAMARLPRDQRAAVYLSAVEGYTAQEIGAMMGAPENTVYSWIAKGKKRLREVLL